VIQALEDSEVAQIAAEDWDWPNDERAETGFQFIGIVCVCMGLWELWRRRCLKRTYYAVCQKARGV